MYEKLLLSPGSVFIREHETCFDLFIIVSGKARALRTLNGKVVSVAYFSKSDVVGEQSFLTGNPRSTTVEAITDMEVIRIPFHAPLSADPSEEAQRVSFLLRSLINRVRHSSDRIASLEMALEMQKVSLKNGIPLEQIAPELQRFLLALWAADQRLKIQSPPTDSGLDFLDCLLKETLKLFGPSFLRAENVFETLKCLHYFGRETQSPSERRLDEKRILDLISEMNLVDRGVAFLSLLPVELEILTHTFGHVMHSRRDALETALTRHGRIRVRLRDVRGLDELSRHPKYFDHLRSLQKKGWFVVESDSALQVNVDHALLQNELLQIVKVAKLPMLKTPN